MKFKILVTALTFIVCTTSQIEAFGNCCQKSCSKGASSTPKKLSKQEIAALKAQGGVVYDEYGDAWHPIRYRTEFTAAQWKTILLQKRIRVPLTAKDQRALSELLVGE